MRFVPAIPSILRIQRRSGFKHQDQRIAVKQLANVFTPVTIRGSWRGVSRMKEAVRHLLRPAGIWPVDNYWVLGSGTGWALSSSSRCCDSVREWRRTERKTAFLTSISMTRGRVSINSGRSSNAWPITWRTRRQWKEDADAGAARGPHDPCNLTEEIRCVRSLLQLVAVSRGTGQCDTG